MARAIKRISTQRGHDVTGHVLCCFGGAAGPARLPGRRRARHDAACSCTRWPACSAPTAWGSPTCARCASAASRPPLEEADGARPRPRHWRSSRAAAVDGARTPGHRRRGRARRAPRPTSSTGAPTSRCRCRGPIRTRWPPRSCERCTARRYGFLMPGRGLALEAVAVEAVGAGERVGAEAELAPAERRPTAARPHARTATRTWPPAAPRSRRAAVAGVFTGGRLARGAGVRARGPAAGAPSSTGPAIVCEPTSTTVVEPGWRAEVLAGGELLLRRTSPPARPSADPAHVSPLLLEVFNNLFMSIAEQMGATLANTAVSVNIKERLDFSCAVFDAEGGLVANAPHLPVHLGSMGASVQAVLERHRGELRPGDAWLLNSPYAGGTHLPDLTVVTPVFLEADAAHGRGGAAVPRAAPLFFVASRAHHADVGGVTPGSMPPGQPHASTRRASSSRTSGSSRTAACARPRCAELLTSGRAPRPRPAAEPRRPARPGGGQRPRRGRAGAHGRRVRPPGRHRLHAPRAGQRRGGRAPRARRLRRRGGRAATLPPGDGRRQRDRRRRDRRPRRAPRDRRLHRHLAAARRQLQRPGGGDDGGRALRLPHARRRRHPAQRRLPRAARHRRPAG